MTKKQREAKAREKTPKSRRRRGHHKGLRPNPYVSPFGTEKAGSVVNYESPFPFEMLADSCGDLLVKQALIGCTFQEKTIIAGLIPLVIPILRKGGQVSVEPQSANAERQQPTNKG